MPKMEISFSQTPMEFTGRQNPDSSNNKLCFAPYIIQRISACGLSAVKSSCFHDDFLITGAGDASACNCYSS